MKPVTFPYGAIKMAGQLYLPPAFDSSKRYSAIVVAHPFGGVKEQTAGIYARKLAEAGFVALAFDASHTGESGGDPRYEEVPADRINGIRSAVDYFTTLPFVDKERIGSLGLCAGGMYSISTAATETRIKAVAAVSMWDIADESRRGLLRTVPEQDRQRRLREVSEQRTKEAHGGEVRYANTSPLTPEQVVQEARDSRDAYEYYRTPRANHPRAINLYRFTSIGDLMTFYPFAQIETISPRPIHFIVGSEAVSKYFSDEAYKLAAEPKEMVVLPGGGHFDLYDRPAYVDPAVQKLAEFYNKNLEGSHRGPR